MSSQLIPSAQPTTGLIRTRCIHCDSVFGIEPNEHAIYLDVKQFLANQRQGTHKSKERAEITGSTKKIKKQKGTGTARAGSIKNPLFKGGGRVFGPEPSKIDCEKSLLDFSAQHWLRLRIGE